jgi:dihydrofolate synthase/folylpolyglutamate synthase
VGPRQAYRATVRDVGWDGTLVDAWTPAGRLPDLRVGLIGAHQAQNAAVALALLDALVERWELRVSEQAIRSGLASARWPGRLELLDGRSVGLGRVLLDGAHNPAGAASLAAALNGLGLERPTIVFGAMRAKDVRGVLRALAPIQPRFIFTRVDDPGASEPEELARAWRSLSGRPSTVAATPEDALARADADPIVVAGSLYLVGAVRGMILPMADDDR